MPIHVVTCPVHGDQEIFVKDYRSIEEAPCPICGRQSPRNWRLSQGQPDCFKPYWTKALAPEPVYVASRREEREWEKKTGFVRVS